MPETWPADFPCFFEIGSDSESIGDGRIESNPDIGPALVRRRSSAVPGSIAGTMPFTKAQLAQLKAFVETTLAGGTLPFEFPAQSAAGVLLVRFPKDGLPSWQRIAQDRYRVRLQLSVMP